MTARKQDEVVKVGPSPGAEVIPFNVYQRLSKAKKLVAEHTFKKIEGKELKYPYLPIDQVKPIIEDAMNEAGLILLYGELEGLEDVREPWIKVNSYGDPVYWMHKTARQTFTWVNIDNPEDTLAVEFSGEAKDNSDKVLSKLYTATLKNFIKAQFNISDSPKDDTDDTEDEVRAEKDEAARAARRQKVIDDAKKDPFFGKMPKGTPIKIAPKDDHKEAVTDRPREVMVDTIFKASRRAATRGIVTKFSKTAGDDPHTWSDEVVADCYAEICDAMKEAEE